MPGFSVGKAENKLGIRASSTCPLSFDQVKVCWLRTHCCSALVASVNSSYHSLLYGLLLTCFTQVNMCWLRTHCCSALMASVNSYYRSFVVRLVTDVFHTSEGVLIAYSLLQCSSGISKQFLSQLVVWLVTHVLHTHHLKLVCLTSFDNVYFVCSKTSVSVTQMSIDAVIWTVNLTADVCSFTPDCLPGTHFHTSSLVNLLT